jgi:Fe-Mn family superoxide dismutase
MSIELPALGYGNDALEPYLSAETLDFHYGKHHRAYVDNLNKLIAGTEFESMGLDDIVKKASGPIFNNAAQIWNHNFYWNCLTPSTTPEPFGPIAVQLKKHFGSIDDFKRRFTESALGNFGSGWTWLVKKKDGVLAIENTANADTPLLRGDKPLLTCDVWEHAYYIDYHNARAKYLENFWKIVDWEFMTQKLFS